MKNMKRIYVLLCTLLLMMGGANANATCGIFEPEENKEEEILSLETEKESKIDKESFWEKITNSDSKTSIISDDDKKLYAPPPGEPGNPQKIVAPLGSGEIMFFLLLSVLTIGFYRKKRQKQTISEG